MYSFVMTDWLLTLFIQVHWARLKSLTGHVPPPGRDFAHAWATHLAVNGLFSLLVAADRPPLIYEAEGIATLLECRQAKVNVLF